MSGLWRRWAGWLIAMAVVTVVVLVAWAWRDHLGRQTEAGLVSGNGRIEATEVDIATKGGGRLQELLVAEGDFVIPGQPLARMQSNTLQAQRDEAQALAAQAEQSVAGAQAEVALRISSQQAAVAAVRQRQSELEAARQRLARTEVLAAERAVSNQLLDDDRARVRHAEAALAAARAQAAAAQAAVRAAEVQTGAARSTVQAAQATLKRIEAEVSDTELRAPRAGRVQYVLAQPGEVLGAGGKVLNLVDLSDVYMTFFLPETVAGRIALGSEVRIVLDAAPGRVIPARVSFVASTAQFTPKTVETASERQKLMFRVKARIDRALLQQHIQRVKTGLPGVAWLRLDEKDGQPDWPARLSQGLVSAASSGSAASAPRAP